MPRKTDRLYVTQTEHSGVHGKHTAGGSTSRASAAADPSSSYQPIPFTSCAISLQPWTNPVCDPRDGTIYELTNILPWLKRHGDTSPATGQPLRASDLLTLHFHRNADGHLHDPVSFKPFNDSTHLVAIATSGNVFAWDTIQQLNIKVKFWEDLLSGEAFKRADLITLQDPTDVGKKSVANLHHLRQGLRKDDAEAQDEVNVKATGSASALIASIRKKEVEARGGGSKGALDDGKTAPPSTTPKTKAANPATAPPPPPPRSTGATAASFTSTSLTPRTHTSYETRAADETMYDSMRSNARKGYVRLTTNFGPLNLELHCDKAPRTCHNFLTLCQRGYYTDTLFHRNIPGFMIQGGDPTGTGRGGESMWGKDFGDELGLPHDSRGVLSMANRGAGTNGSQFFVTYGAKRHLDKKHSVFGRLVDSPSKTLDALEKIPTEPGTDKPLRSIRILDVQVFTDPYEEYAEKEQRKLRRNDEAEVAKREEKRKKRENDRTTWFGTSVRADGEMKHDNVNGGSDGPIPTLSSLSGVGRYVTQNSNGSSKTKKQAADDDDADIGIAPIPNKKRKGGGFGDFSGW